ncbi:hypothetical protein FRC02_000084 [Tulasnella sp. 418]|nr:hypothetical protein FRC02_000084 [Tulasnella sp. 418]
MQNLARKHILVSGLQNDQTPLTSVSGIPYFGARISSDSKLSLSYPDVALQDYTKRQKALLNPPEASDQPSPSPHLPPGPKQDFSLKAGETLGSISIPGGSSKRSAKTTTDLLGPTKASGSSSGILPLLPPPPTAPKRR